MNVLEKFRFIHTFIFDVDGVLTDGTVTILENGSLIRTMHIKDGFALKQAVKAGYKVAIITGGKSSGVVQRLRNLGITDIYSGVEDKLEAYRELRESYELDPQGILYMGDDLPDYEVMNMVGLASCPADAVPEIRQKADFVSGFSGGRGCVREVIEKVMKLHGKWIGTGSKITHPF